MAVNKLIATFENERRRQGIKAAKAAGKYIGRRTVINKKLIDQVQDLKENKNLSITQIAKVTGRGRTTIYKVLKETQFLGVNKDWISFNLQGSVAITPIANYLFQAFGFNSTITRIIKGKWKSKDLNYNNIFKFLLYRLAA